MKMEGLCILDMRVEEGKIIGVGISDEPDRVFSGIEQYPGPCSIQCYVSPSVTIPEWFSGSVICSSHPWQDLVSHLVSGTIHAAVRGSLPANETLQNLKTACGVEQLERVVLLETYAGERFLLAPVGVDEGWSVKDKISIIKRGREVCKKFGLPETVSILSGGRLGDVGRHPVVDRTLADAELISRLTGAEHKGILIEEVYGKSGLIIAPDGISGNLIFRTLLFLGNGRSYGAPVLNIDKIFVDTSRVNPDYHYALIMATRLLME